MQDSAVRFEAEPRDPQSPGGGPSGLRCSARGCRNAASWALRWNNPRLHEPDRRKTWLACDEHRDTLGAFLSRRGFLRETTPLATD